MCCAAAGAYARGVWLLQAGAGRRRQRRRQKQQRRRRRRQLGGGGDGGNGSVGDDGATRGSVQGRGGGVPLREEADSPLHRRHPDGEDGVSLCWPGWS
uniref:Gametotin binding protein 2 n=1 Tax=Pan paniscus TaxID=9597 RepID=A0A2R8ZCS1_PANPA